MSAVSTSEGFKNGNQFLSKLHDSGNTILKLSSVVTSLNNTSIIGVSAI